MATIKQRINITANESVEKMIKHLAKRDNMPVSAKALDLLRLALDLEEDMIWANIADKRKDNGPYIEHEKFWKGKI
ncbi:MAG TPA: hypothetical protein VJG67_01810 [Candidatus Paceibacterota bacterium]